MVRDPKADDARKYAPEGAPDSVTERLPRAKLSKDLQSIVDKEDDWLDSLYEGGYAIPPQIHFVQR